MFSYNKLAPPEIQYVGRESLFLALVYTDAVGHGEVVFVEIGLHNGDYYRNRRIFLSAYTMNCTYVGCHLQRIQSQYPHTQYASLALFGAPQDAATDASEQSASVDKDSHVASKM